MRKIKSNVAKLGIVGLLSLGAVGGSLAYLTDSEKSVNKFEIGSVRTDLTETEYPGNDRDTPPDVPNTETEKNPRVLNVGSNNAITFLVLDSPLARISTYNDDGTLNEGESTKELYLFKQTGDDVSTHLTNFNSSWVALTDRTSYVRKAGDGTLSEVNAVDVDTTLATLGANERLYLRRVFGYNLPLEPTQETASLFDKVQLQNYGNENVPTEQEIILQSYSIQDKAIISAGQDITNNLNTDGLTAIYDVFLGSQNINDLAITGIRDVDDITNGHVNRWGTTTDVTSAGANVRP